MIEQVINIHNQWTALLGVSVAFFCWSWVLPRFGAVAAVLFGFSSCSSIWYWTEMYNRYLSVDPYNQTALRYFACDSVAKLMLIAVPLMIYSKDRERFKYFGETIAPLFVAANSLLAIYEGIATGDCGNNNCGGIIGNPSISMGAMVCMLPVFITSFRKQWFVLSLAVIASFISQSSVAMGLLAAYFGLWLFPWKMLRDGIPYKQLAYSCACVVAVMASAHFAVGKELTNDSDRFKTWHQMFHHWNVPLNYLTGTGLGTYHVFSVNLQGQDLGAVPKFWWNTLHNDFLQMLFECGIVGFLLLFAAYGSALLKTLKEYDYRISLSIVLFGLYMTLDPALHNPIPVLFGAWLFVYALRREPTKEYL